MPVGTGDESAPWISKGVPRPLATSAGKLFFQAAIETLWEDFEAIFAERFSPPKRILREDLSCDDRGGTLNFAILSQNKFSNRCLGQRKGTTSPGFNQRLFLYKSNDNTYAFRQPRNLEKPGLDLPSIFSGA